MKRVAAVLFCVAVARPAFADSVDDFQRGSSFQIQTIGATINGGSVQTGMVFVPKTPGSLDFTVNTKSFGVSADVNIPFHGTRTASNIITYTFDVHTSVDVGWPFSIDRFRGTLILLVTPLPSTSNPICANSLSCPYNVVLTNLPGSTATVTINTDLALVADRDEKASNIVVSMLGGLPAPKLADFTISAPRMLCQNSNLTQVTGTVDSVLLAPTGGGWVSVVSSDPTGVSALGTTISAGTQTAQFPIWISPNWSGTATLTAFSAGTSKSAKLRVLSSQQCAIGRWGAIFQLPCGFDCFVPQAISQDGAIAGLLEGKLTVVSSNRETRISVAEQVPNGLHDVSGVRINSTGMMVGKALDKNGAALSFFVGGLGLKTKPPKMATFPGVSFEQLDDQGVAVGSRVSGKATRAFVFNGRKGFDLPIEAQWSRAVGLDRRHNILGNMGVAGRSRPFLFALDNGKFRAVPLLVGDKRDAFSSTATAISPSGYVVGFVEEGGHARAFLLSPRKSRGNSEAVNLGELAGYDDLEPVAVNDRGIVVGNAFKQAAKRVPSTVFVWTREKGLLELAKLLPANLGVVPTRALALDGSGAILFEGTRNGKTVALVVGPEGAGK
jgi:hypothetical protein